MDYSIIENTLVNREFMYRYTWRFFASEPDEAMFELVRSEVAAAQASVMFEEGSAGAKVQAKLAELALPENLDQYRDEFTRLFLGPAKPVAPLWESVYRDPDELLFQQSTLDVREAYRAAGFEARAYPKEADDHLAIELDFMAALSNSALKCILEGNASGAKAYIGYQRAFLEHHLCKWVGMLCDRLSRDIPENVSSFYLYAVNLVVELCKTDLVVNDMCLDILG